MLRAISQSDSEDGASHHEQAICLRVLGPPSHTHDPHWSGRRKTDFERKGALGPNESRHIGCGDIADIFENLDKLEEAVKIGQFWVYGFGNEDEYDVTFSHNVLVLAIAAGL